MTYDLDALPKSLLTTGNPKTAKGEAHGFLTAILHFAPASLSGRNVCPHSTAGCRAACLNTAGRGGIGLDAEGLNVIQAARIQRTRWWQRDREGFMAALVLDVERKLRLAKTHGLRLCVRPNGTQDLPWERFPCVRAGVSYPNLMAAFPEVQFYDYTKWPARLRAAARSIPNYHLTFSLAEDNDAKAADALDAGMNVAAVFAVRKGQSLPAAYLGRPVVDGDATDLRFLDPAEGVVVGLRAKGRAIHDRSGFVRAAA